MEEAKEELKHKIVVVARGLECTTVKSEIILYTRTLVKLSQMLVNLLEVERILSQKSGGGTKGHT